MLHLRAPSLDCLVLSLLPCAAALALARSSCALAFLLLLQGPVGRAAQDRRAARAAGGLNDTELERDG